MFSTTEEIEFLNKRIAQANGHLKINEGHGFIPALSDQLEPIVSKIKNKTYKVIGYTEKCHGGIPYEISLAVRKI